jgi:hypothetical protein
MAYISRIAVERALRSIEEAPSGATSFHHATEAAHVYWRLLADMPGDLRTRCTAVSPVAWTLP